VTSPAPAVTSAWAGALSAEFAAVFRYGALGPRLTDVDQIALARRSEQGHRELRDRTAGALAAAGQAPPAPQADYPLPFPVTGPVDAQRLAVRVEEDCAAAWRFLVTVTASNPSPADLRGSAGDALTASAVRATRWRRILRPAQPTVPFPGT
jgi:uncharacterized protein DUF4439